MKTLAEIQTIVSAIYYPGMKFVVKHEGGYFHLRVEFDAFDNVTGEPASWNGRWWRLSVHMTDGEIVQTAFKAVMTALEHEAREQFKFMGTPVFDPHYDIYKLVALRLQADALQERATVGKDPVLGMGYTGPVLATVKLDKEERPFIAAPHGSEYEDDKGAIPSRSETFTPKAPEPCCKVCGYPLYMHDKGQCGLIGRVEPDDGNLHRDWPVDYIVKDSGC